MSKVTIPVLVIVAAFLGSASVSWITNRPAVAQDGYYGEYYKAETEYQYEILPCDKGEYDAFVKFNKLTGEISAVNNESFRPIDETKQYPRYVGVCDSKKGRFFLVDQDEGEVLVYDNGSTSKISID